MREQFVAFLNRHPSVIGIPFLLAGLWEFINATFRYDAHRRGRERLLRRNAWLRILGTKPSLPRPAAIVGGLWIALIGAILIDAELAQQPRHFWLVPLSLMTIGFFIVLGVTKLQGWMAKR